MDDYAIEGAESHGRPVAQVKRDIETPFTLHNLDTPAENLESRLKRVGVRHKAFDFFSKASMHC